MRRRCFGALAALGLLAVCSASAAAADWPTFHGDNTRQGNDASDSSMTNPGVAWTSQQLDGQIYAEPVISGGRVIVATENNSVYSLDPATGQVQWHAGPLGTPRSGSGTVTCGDISPMGITSTPAIDAGNIYVVANIQDSSTSYHFELYSLNLTTGATNWSANVDPPDISNPSENTWATEASTMEDRGAILVTDGKVFIPMGGNDGDCGGYHGYLISYPESGSGSLSWWASTEYNADGSGDTGGTGAADWSEGGVSEDSSGNVYIATGNSNHGQSTDKYDYSDGVIKFDPASPALTPTDYFAPDGGTVSNTWYGDNAGDTDLGSTSPLQLPNNRIFIVGKSGVGYLLNSTNLGHLGGQVAEHQVCTGGSTPYADEAFGALAYANGVVYVGCKNGLAAVQISSNSDDFFNYWYNTSNVATHPPIVAGGAVWSVDQGFGHVDAFSPTTGQLLQSFPISGGIDNHFVTPSAANGQLYVGAGEYVDAFALHPFVVPTAGSPVTALSPDQGQQLVFWRGPSDNHLYEIWYSYGTGQWYGPEDLTAALGVPSSGYLASAPTVVFTPDGGQQLVFWQGANGDLWEAWYTYALSSWNVQDLTSARGLAGAGTVASRPSVSFTPGGGQQLVFWQGSNHDLWEAWYTVALSTWYSQDLSTGLLGGAGAGTLASAPTVILTPGGGQQLTFWQGTNNDVWEAWYTVATYTWNVQDLTAARFPGAAAVASAPDVLLTPDAGQQLLFYQAAGTGDLWEAWYTVATYSWNAQDLTTTHLGGLGSLASSPDVLVTSGGGQQLVFWQTTGGHLDEAWYTVSAYSWAGQDLSAAAGVPSGGTLTSPPSVVALSSGETDAWWQGSGDTLWELYSSGGGTWLDHDWSIP
jgi:polyvinyl alcohol dehydrogenase (cytochrome)